MTLKVLHVTAYDERGGAAIAASRLHFSLLNIGIESQMLVQQKSSNASSILAEKKFFLKRINRILSFLDTLPARILKKNISNFS
ncbi:glycosyl transferase, partial [Gammaproteobacteria bacterium]|nr:glycosyl transferase [Gammaproteobacteria bacterium]